MILDSGKRRGHVVLEVVGYGVHGVANFAELRELRVEGAEGEETLGDRDFGLCTGEHGTDERAHIRS